MNVKSIDLKSKIQKEETIMIRAIINSNISACNLFDKLFPTKITVDGNRDFIISTKQLIPDGIVVADIGGGKQPLFSADEVKQKNLKVIGVDIDKEELDSSPAGSYMQKDCVDVTSHHSSIKVDAVVVQSLLEHVEDGKAAVIGISSYCKKETHVYTFCPNRYAWFAIINRILPQKIKLFILHSIYPGTKNSQGFPAYYSECTPGRMINNLKCSGFEILELRTYFISSYFKFCFPFYILWRLINYPLIILWPNIFCETFSIHAVKK